MMREEFIKLTNVEVSGRFYTEKIEPEYMNGDWADKQEFCAQWVKKNKGAICKAHISDVDGLSRDIACMEAMKAQADRASDLVKEANEKARLADVEAHNAKYQNTKLSEEIEKLKEDLCNRVNQADVDRMKDEHKTDIHFKDMEIMELKAMLFDLLHSKGA